MPFENLIKEAIYFYVHYITSAPRTSKEKTYGKFQYRKIIKKRKKSKYWLCQNMNITNRNLNRIIKGETFSISFKYLEALCQYLEYSIDELIDIKKDA